MAKKKKHIDTSRWEHGQVVRTRNGGDHPPNSDMILVLDADIWRPMCGEMSVGTREKIPSVYLRTGRYLDLILMAARGPTKRNAPAGVEPRKTNVRKIITTATGREECTHRIVGIRDSDGDVIKEPVLIQFGNMLPELNILEELIFGRMLHRSEDRHTFHVDKSRGGKGRLNASFEVRTTSQCQEYLAGLLAAYATGRKRVFLRHIEEHGRHTGEITDLLYATEEKETPGPVYVVSNDLAVREMVSGQTTPRGRAIGAVDLSGLVRALCESGFLFDLGVKCEPGRNISDEEALYIELRRGINRSSKALNPGSQGVIHHWNDALDRAGKFYDGIEGLTLTERLQGRAIFWDENVARSRMPSITVEDLSEALESAQQRGLGKRSF